jgi:hypothetical protein
VASLPGFSGKLQTDSGASLPGIGGKFGPDYAQVSLKPTPKRLWQVHSVVVTKFLIFDYLY